MTSTRLYLAFAALFGLAGVAMLAGGAHASGPSMTIAGQMLLFHAPAIMAGALARKLEFLHVRVSQIALALMVLGAALFAGDLALRASQGVPLFPMAAPAGGLLAMGGWAGLAVAAIMGRWR
jgi:uncharacterized membrane protein YgdD (TMEM256/DUF423 family)